MHVVVPVATVHAAVGCQQHALVRCLVAVSVLQLVVAAPQLAVWTVAAMLPVTAVSGFAGRPVTAEYDFAQRPVGNWSVPRNQLTDVILSCRVMTWN